VVKLPLAPLMIRIAITAEASEALAATMLLGCPLQKNHRVVLRVGPS
jgi:hypothetical protein